MYRAAASRILTNSKSALFNKSHSNNVRPRFFSSTAKPKKTFVEWYEGHLEQRPVLTKMCTGCILWGVGDAVAQLVPQMAAEKKEDGTQEPIEYDFPRTGRAVLYGFALHAPTSHLHFNFLEWMTQKAGVKGLGIPVFKTFMEQVRLFRFLY
jgi:hypothetical protein